MWVWTEWVYGWNGIRWNGREQNEVDKMGLDDVGVDEVQIYLKNYEICEKGKFGAYRENLIFWTTGSVEFKSAHVWHI